MKIIENVFRENKAKIGGGYAYEFYEPETEKNTFERNYATEYGPNRAGYPANLVLLT